MTKHEEIKTMKLYNHLDRIERRLQRARQQSNDPADTSGPETDRDEKTPLDPELLGTVDTLHYFGDEPIQKIQQLIAAQGVPSDVRVLDIGTGYGGSARLLAHRTGCRVDALELQPDLSAVAQQLTARCALDDRVAHLTGDFLLRPVAATQYNVVVGLLCFMHVGHWRELFSRCFESLKPGGVLYAEDFFQRGEAFSAHEQHILTHDIYCAPLPTQPEMLALLQDVGFTDVQLEDATPKWKPYLIERAQIFRSELPTHIQVDGEDAAKALDHFYTNVAELFAMGNIGGYMLTARRPHGNQQ